MEIISRNYHCFIKCSRQAICENALKEGIESHRKEEMARKRKEGKKRKMEGREGSGRRKERKEGECPS